MKFLLAFAGWATLVFAPAWWLSKPWQAAIGAVAVRVVTPPGASLRITSLELFYPMDLAVFVALCLASGWASWARRGRGLLVGVPIMVVAEIAALALALASMLGARHAIAGSAEQAAAMRLTDSIIRVVGLAIAALVWFVVLGHERVLARPVAGLRTSQRSKPRGGAR
ncbi:MAG: hypothetical protein HOP12_08605 [Candidatus Eisenbacteria bacterium]|uniref:Uncharacterized protein n=1 Tax=Eiseniibacteriota bacterium TaxID=2212470 RepID=A0A849SKJ3_UNCEI|nr:hypothetical protein [Candidatus Eisenbacteria bacterium]